MTTATITIELEITVEADPDDCGFAVVSVQAVTGYDAATQVWRMSPTFDPAKLADLVEAHFYNDALSAINEQAAEDHADYIDGRGDYEYERSREAF